MVESELSSYWPVFGNRTNAENNTNSFWQKNLQEDFDINEEQLLQEGVLSRIGKKQKKVKNYYYKLFGQFLCYYQQPNDQVYKGYLKLDENVNLEKKSLQGKNQVFYYLNLTKQDNIRKIYSKEPEIIDQWYSAMKTKCILTGFNNFYVRNEILGNANFANIYKVLRIVDEKIFAAHVYNKQKLEECKDKEDFVNSKETVSNEYQKLIKTKAQSSSLKEIYQESDYCACVYELQDQPNIGLGNVTNVIQIQSIQNQHNSHFNQLDREE